MSSIFLSIDCENNSTILNSIKNEKSFNKIFLSSTLSLPIQPQNNQYNAILNFTIPKSFLDKNLNFYLKTRNLKLINNHSMPNDLLGKIENIQELFKSIFLKQKKDVIPLKFNWDQGSLSYPLLMNSRCFMEFIIKNIGDIYEENIVDKDYTIINENKRSNYIMNNNNNNDMNIKLNSNSNSFYNSKGFDFKNHNDNNHNNNQILNINSKKYIFN